MEDAVGPKAALGDHGYPGLEDVGQSAVIFDRNRSSPILLGELDMQSALASLDVVLHHPGDAHVTARRLCAELGENPAVLAHRYALSLDIATLVLGVKNRQELTECVAAAEAGPLPPDLVARIDGSVDRSADT